VNEWSGLIKPDDEIFAPFYYLLLLAVFSSCHKQVENSGQPNGKVLLGAWELRGVSGGDLPYNANNYNPGNSILWKFTENEFARIYKDSVYRSGTYTISLGTGTDLNTGRKIDQFIFNNEPADDFELRNDTLRFYYGFIPADGGIEMFVKIRDGQ
jgi:hypothetical protein